MELAAWKQHLVVTLSSNMQFEATVPSVPVGPMTVNGAAGTELLSVTTLSIGSFDYRIRHAVIDHSPVGLEKVFWRLDDARLFVICHQADLRQSFEGLRLAPAWCWPSSSIRG